MNTNWIGQTSGELLGFRVDVDESLAANEIRFVDNGRFSLIMKQMSALGWEFRSEPVEITSIPEGERLHVTAAWNLRLFKNGVEKSKAEWDDDMRVIVEAGMFTAG